jgi:hypothetical protein
VKSKTGRRQLGGIEPGDAAADELHAVHGGVAPYGVCKVTAFHAHVQQSQPLEPGPPEVEILQDRPLQGQLLQGPCGKGLS